MNYEITRDYIKHGNARSGQKIDRHLFGVAHDTGNPGSTARGNRNYFNNSQPSASAHTFIDDKEILEIVPLDEKAWHNRYDNPEDNAMFGDDANDTAIGVELCFGGSINFEEAYKRYVFYWAYLCKKYKWDPRKQIVAHATLDPRRRTDPHNALNKNGKTFQGFINDVLKEMGSNTPAQPTTPSQPAKTVNDDRFMIRVKVANLHTYKTANWNDKSGPIVGIGEIFTVKRTLTVNGSKMYELISGLYITGSDKYVEIYKAPVKKPEAKKQKYIEITVGSLWTYDTANWNDKSVIVNDGDVFTVIKDKFKVGGGEMYQIKSGLYITANPKYVRVFEK